MKRYRRMMGYALRRRRGLAVIFVLTIAASGTAALQPWPMKLLVDYALSDAGPPPAWQAWADRVGAGSTALTLVIAAAVASVAVFLLNGLLNFAISYAWGVHGHRMAYDLAGDLFARMQRLSLRFHGRQPVGDLLSRLTGDAWCVLDMTSNLLMGPLQEILVLVAMVAIGYALDPVLATLSLAVAPLLALASRSFGGRLKRRSKLGREAESRLMSFTQQTLRAVPLVQAYGAAERHTATFQELADDAVILNQRGKLLGSGYGLVSGLITTTGMAVVLFVGGVRVLGGAIPLGTLLVFLAYVRRMQAASGGLFKVYTKLKSAEASIDRILEVMDSDDEVIEACDAVTWRSKVRGHLRFEDVTYGYQPDRPVLTGVCLEARPGEVVALVGPTGAGKSTLAGMVPRFFDPWSGRVMLDGLDIRNVRISVLRAQVSVVLQDPFLMPLSIAENIAYGRPDADREAIIAAARHAQADGFIRELPDGYDTVIGENGATLSGGQKQRLAIARAFLKNAPVLILDEPTSALDAQTESALVEALERLMEGRTTLIIAHRLSTIRHADRIAVLDRGRLVELGAHDELMAHGGVYSRFHACQFGGAVRDAVTL